MSSSDADPRPAGGRFRMRMIPPSAAIAALGGMIGIATAATSSDAAATTTVQTAPDGSAPVPAEPCPTDGIGGGAGANPGITPAPPSSTTTTGGT